MRILLVALNARYVHTNLAVRYLRGILEEQGENDWEVEIKEYSINEQLEKIAAEIYEAKPDMVGFSCYIWNIAQTTALFRRLRLVLPGVYFLLGGPEVSFHPEELLTKSSEIDAILMGEGESSLPALVKAWSAGELPWDVKGLAWRMQKPIESEESKGLIPLAYQGEFTENETGMIFINERSPAYPDLNTIPNPYGKAEDFHGRLVYVETSRGCPFSCQFCISSTFQGIRYLEPEKFRLILHKLFNCGARTIKFVDRTFNARKKHAFEILDVFREEAEVLLAQVDNKRPGEVPRAHCEIAGELLDGEWLEYLKNYPPGMIQLEIGVQSTHQPALEAVERPQNFARWQDKVRFLQQDCNIPVHLDLIAGLPLEGWKEFRHSFDQVFAVRPNNLQLGFLKVLKGSGLWEKSDDFGLVYSPDPPYTILRTNSLTHGEILAFTRVEEILEKYYNTGNFQYSLEYILKEENSSFDFFHSFAEYWQENGWFRREWNPKALFENLWSFLQHANNFSRNYSNSPYLGTSENLLELWREALRFDYYLLERPGRVPDFLQGNWSKNQSSELERQKEEIKNNPRWQEIIPRAKDLDKRQWARATAVEYFSVDVPGYNNAKAGFGIKKGERSGFWYLFYYQGRTRQYFEADVSTETVK